MNKFIERFQNALKSKNITQGELAEMVGTTGSTISRYVNQERKPNAELLGRIATVLNVSTDYLLGNTADSTPPNKNAPPEINTEEALLIALRGMLKREPTEDELKRFLNMGKVFFNIQDEHTN